MQSYNPFSRGTNPVGVTTLDLMDGSRSRPLPTEVWYPATAEFAGRDTDDATRDHYEVLEGFPPAAQDAVRDADRAQGCFPLVIFSHGFGGHRRQSSHLCTHLASHGYIVASGDHTGNTIVDMARITMELMGGGEMPDPVTMITEMIEARPRDAVFVIDSMLSGDMKDAIDADRVGMTGHSFGGWTTICATARDQRIRAAMPLAPAGGSAPLPVNPLAESIDFNWGRDVPTLYLVADKDTLLPLPGMYELLEATPARKKMVILDNSDHMHFCDNVEATHEMFRTMPPPGPLEEIAKQVPPASEFVPGEHAYEYLRGLGLAHMDAHLKQHSDAAAWLDGDLEGALKERGVSVSIG